MKTFFLFCCVYLPLEGLAQFNGGNNTFHFGKPPIDPAAITCWSYVGPGQISDHGDYILYHVVNDENLGNAIVITSADLRWRHNFSNGTVAEFADNGKIACIKIGKDSLCLLTLGTAKANYIAHLLDFQVCRSNDKWVAIRLRQPTGSLIFQRLDSNRSIHLDSVNTYQLSGDGKTVLFSSVTKDNQALILLDIATGTRRTIWGSMFDDSAFNFSINANGRQVAFIVKSKKGPPKCSLWYYTYGMHTSIQLLADSADFTEADRANMRIRDDMPQFDPTGSGIYFNMILGRKSSQVDSVAMDVWSTADPAFLLGTYDNGRIRDTYSFFIDLATRVIRRIEGENERIQQRTNGWAFVENGHGEVGTWEAPWNPAGRLSYYLISTKDGRKRLIRDGVQSYIGAVTLSPTGKWAVYFDERIKAYCSFEVTTAVTRTLTQNIPATWTDEKVDLPEAYPAGPIKWLGNDDAMLIEDNFDIWLIDPRGSRPPVNITNGYGRSHHVKFAILNSEAELSKFSLNRHPVLLLRALDNYSKDYGFFTKEIGDSGSPVLRSIGPYAYQSLKKASQAEAYILVRETAESSPNYFITTDFKGFIRLSDIHPESKYNWLTSELIHWKEPNGSTLAGILYKPEDFDPRKKYPVIFAYYERMSDNLHLFPTAGLSQGRLNIPWFVSAGYIVFVPDIVYKIGEPGESAFDAIVSAAHYLAKMAFIDSTKMGLEGHSFGGYETNYIITHSHLFAAACSASGVCDLVSMYGSGARGMFPLYWAERFQGRMGGTLWQIPEKYISNSPIFSADAVTTPVLIMHNKGDDVVPFLQALQFFTALRRLRKSAWLIQYDDGGHEIVGKSSEDFTFKLADFFNYFLRQGTLPVWMQPGFESRKKNDN